MRFQQFAAVAALSTFSVSTLSGCIVIHESNANKNLSIEESEIVACDSWWRNTVLEFRDFEVGGELSVEVAEIDKRHWDSALTQIENLQGEVAAQIRAEFRSRSDYSQWVVSELEAGTLDVMDQLNYPIFRIDRAIQVKCAAMFGEAWTE